MQLVIGAFEIAPNEFELLSLSPETYNAEMRDSKANTGRVDLVRKKVFLEKGEAVGRVTIHVTT